MSMFTNTELLRSHWGVVLIRGIVAILFGITTLLWPHITLLALILLFGAFVFIDGVVAIADGLQERNTSDRWWVFLIEGMIGILIGLAALFWPGITALVLLYIIAIWAVITGVIELVAAFSLGRSLGVEWTLALAGILSLMLGALLFIRPASGALAIVWVIGIYAIIFGAVLIVRAFQFRSLTPVEYGEPG